MIRSLCNFLFGWAIRRHVASKNDRMAAVLIGYAMMDYDITPEMLAHKRKLYRRCVWWGVADEPKDTPLHIPE